MPKTANTWSLAFSSLKIIILGIGNIFTLAIKVACMCFNANSLHYYVLKVPRYEDRWR